MKRSKGILRLGVLAVLAGLLAAAVSSARAEDKVSEFRVGRQAGMIYMSLYVIEEQDLLAKHCKQLGIAPTKLTLISLGSASALSEMLLSGSVDAAAGAITPMLTLWDKTRGAQKVKAIASLSNSVLYLNTNDPKLKSLKDLTDQDRIAVSGVGSSMQAILLEMAAGQAFGDGQERKLDPLTVTMPHPEGLAALLSGNTRVIAAHFATAPFQNIELRDPRIHKLLSTTDILGGYSPASVIFTRQSVYDGNPHMLEAFVAAIDEASGWIEKNPQAAAELYLRREPQKLTVEEFKDLLGNGETKFTSVPENSLKIATFMARIGRLQAPPASWKDYYFPIVTGNGS